MNEKLEEAAKKYAEKWYKSSDELSEFLIGVNANSFKHGAKWQSERMYSEDQVKQAITNFYMNDLLLTPKNLEKVINNLKQQEQ